MRCVFSVLSLIEPTKESSKKTQCIAENGCVNGMWQLGFSWLIIRSGEDTYLSGCSFNHQFIDVLNRNILLPTKMLLNGSFLPRFVGSTLFWQSFYQFGPIILHLDIFKKTSTTRLKSATTRCRLETQRLGGLEYMGRKS